MKRKIKQVLQFVIYKSSQASLYPNKTTELAKTNCKTQRELQPLGEYI